MSKIGNKIIEIDGTGVIVQGEIRVAGIIVIANADSPVVEITDINGMIVFELKDSIANKRFYSYTLANAVPIVRPNITTMTNVERILLYLD